jgi:hypothetical protein
MCIPSSFILRKKKTLLKNSIFFFLKIVSKKLIVFEESLTFVELLRKLYNAYLTDKEVGVVQHYDT